MKSCKQKIFCRELEREKTEISDIVIPEPLTNENGYTIENFLSKLPYNYLLKAEKEIEAEISYRLREVQFLKSIRNTKENLK